MKLSRKIVPALALLLISAVLMTTATFAWFSMNTRATATGMQMETEAGDNVLIANDKTMTKVTDLTKFQTALVATSDVANLRPVSSVNGANFYYVKGFQVSGSGSAVSPDALGTGYEPYAAYDPTNLEAFKANYRVDALKSIVGYTEYAFQVMATNAADVAQDLVIDTLDLTYSGSANIDKAFRVAVFADEFTGASVSTETLVSILRPTGAAYFDSNKAVSAADARTPVSNLDAGAVIASDLPAGETKFYRVVVRVWLEGEDTTCTNATFADLDETWSLDLGISFKDAATATKNLNAQTRAIEILDTYTIGTAPVVVDNVLYYPILNGSAEVATGITNAYLYTTAASGAVTDDIPFYALTKASTTVGSTTLVTYHYPILVTPQCYVTLTVDLTSATAADDVSTNVAIGDPAETYYAITGATLDGKQLYTTAAGPVASDAEIFTIDGGVATDVTVYCKLPAGTP